LGITVKKIEKWSQGKKTGKLLKALSSNSSEIRIAAIKALGPTRDEKAMHQLIALLKDQDVTVRTAAVESLGVMGNARSVEFVRQLWNTENDETLKEKARLALNAIRQTTVEEER
jgi:HEAT repeat protein